MGVILDPFKNNIEMNKVVKQFKIGDWSTNNEGDIPAKIRSLDMDGENIDYMEPSGNIVKNGYFTNSERKATAQEVGEALSQAFMAKLGSEVIDEVEYIEDGDIFKINKITVYRDGKFIEIL